MPPLDFPNSPATGATYTGPNGVIWQYDGAKWISGTSANVYAPIASPAFSGNPTAPTPPPGDADTSLATTQFVSDAVATSLHDVGRNYIHNSMFNIQQRGNPGFIATGYTLDRWKLLLNLDAGSVAAGPFSDAQRAQIGDEEAVNALIVGVTGNAGSAAYTFLYQPVENVRRLANKTVTISLWAYVTTGTAKLGIQLRQDFGTGGSPSAAVDVNGTAVTLSTTPTRYSVTITLPSLAGKTLGTNNDSYVRFGFWFSAGASNNTVSGGIGVQSNTFVLWGVQLELGTVATPLEKRDPADELRVCQRFYQASNTWTAGWAGGAISVGYRTEFPVRMRGTPIAVPADSGSVNINVGTITSSADNRGIIIYGTATAAGPVFLATSYTASADL